MRNSSKNLTLILGLVLLFSIGCQGPNKKTDSKEEVPHEDAGPVQAPKDIITLKEAKVLCENYEDRRIGPIIKFEMEQNGSEEFIPTQFIDFDLKTIKKYIKYVERRARKAKVKPDSLRIYLGNYGSEGQDPNRNTVFIVPTTTIDGDHGGFYIDSDGNAQLIRNYWPKSQEGGQEGEPKSKASFFPSLSAPMYQNGSLTLNHGQSGPPPTGDF